MTDISAAGFDPIFWMHHSNVDRLWQEWINANPGKNITVDQLNSAQWPYRFFTPDGKEDFYNSCNPNNPTETCMAEVQAAITNTDYVYADKDDNTFAPPSSTSKEVFLAAKPARTLETLRNTATLNANLGKAERNELKVSLSGEKPTLLAVAPGAHTILEAQVSFNDPHLAFYSVYANLPAEVEPGSEESKKYYVGGMRLFVHLPKGETGRQIVRFDITSALVASGKTAGDAVLTVVKDADSPYNAAPTIDKIDVYTLTDSPAEK
jgi:hypothetical protein